MGKQGVSMAGGNITVTLQDLLGKEAKEQAMWAERERA